MLIATPSQTVGPYFRLGLDALNSDQLAPQGSADLLTVTGCLRDADGVAIPDAVIEVWQADPQGQYAFVDGKRNSRARADWSGFARIPSGPDGQFRFHTVRPGPVQMPDGQVQSAHALVLIGMRGLLKFLMTRMYFPHPQTSSDAVLGAVPEQRRATLVARVVDAANLAWDVHMGGPLETVFFDY